MPALAREPTPTPATAAVSDATREAAGQRGTRSMVGRRIICHQPVQRLTDRPARQRPRGRAAQAGLPGAASATAAFGESRLTESLLSCCNRSDLQCDVATTRYAVVALAAADDTNKALL